jgi:hypothetical protein
MRATGWRAWLVGTAVFATSTALVVIVALLLLGIGFGMHLPPRAGEAQDPNFHLEFQ